MITFMNDIYSTSKYLAGMNGEFDFSEEKEEKYLEEKCKSPQDILISAFSSNGSIIGNITISSLGAYKKMEHRRTLAIAVSSIWRGKGIGKRLMKEGVDIAKKEGILQLELEVAQSNDVAIKLYSSFGFKDTGVTERGLKQEDGSFENLISIYL